MTFTDVETIEAQAAAARQQLGIGSDSPIPDILGLIDGRGAFVFVLPLPEDGIAGAYIHDERDNHFILINQSHAPVRKRFTLAHEYGHFKLGHGSKADENISFSDDAEDERAANDFAGAFLMPRQAVQNWLDSENSELDFTKLVAAARFFGVSASAMCYRLAKLEKINASTRHDWFERINRREHLNLPEPQLPPAMQDTIVVEARRDAHVPFAMQKRLAVLREADLLNDDQVDALRRTSQEAEAVEEDDVDIPESDL